MVSFCVTKYTNIIDFKWKAYGESWITYRENDTELFGPLFVLLSYCIFLYVMMLRCKNNESCYEDWIYP